MLSPYNALHAAQTEQDAAMALLSGGRAILQASVYV